MGLLIVTLGERLKIWDRFDLDEGTQYVLLLMENEDGRRSFRLVEQERALTEVAQNNDVVLLSKPVPHALAASRNLMQISELVRLSDDQSFYVDGHGNWFTAEEYEDSVQGHSITRWVRGRPPKLAPK